MPQRRLLKNHTQQLQNHPLKPPSPCCARNLIPSVAPIPPSQFPMSSETPPHHPLSVLGQQSLCHLQKSRLHRFGTVLPVDLLAAPTPLLSSSETPRRMDG